MSTAFLQLWIQSPRNRSHISLLHNCSTGLRYASLNSAIGRGLRKSQGVGFRGKERTGSQSPRNATSDDRKPFMRRSSEAPGFARAESPISRDGIRKALAVGGRNVFGNGVDATTRLRRGKVDIKDSERPVRRSRAARFHDPDRSFGKKSAARNDRFEQQTFSIKDEREQGNLGRSRPFITDASRRAALSDLKEREMNPNSSKLSQSRLAYLEKSAGQNKRQSQQSDLSRGGSQELQEPFRKSLSFKSRDFDRDSRYPKDASRSRFDKAEGPRDFGKSKYPRDAPSNTSWETEFPETRNTEREPRLRDGLWKRFDDSPKPISRDFDRGPKYSQDEHRGRDTRWGQPERNPEEQEVKARSTFDKRMPLIIPYTTPASEFLYGTSVVEAALKSNRMPRRQLYKLYIYTGDNRDNAETDKRLAHLARRNNVSVDYVGIESLRLMDKLSGSRPHNGYILEASPLPRLPITSLGGFDSSSSESGFTVTLDYQSREEAAVNGTNTFIPFPTHRSGRKPFVLLLDSILDPGNLGGIIRTASFLGVTAIAISTRNSAPFTPVVLKASAGASENVTLFSVKTPAGFLVESKAAGWKVYAAVAPPNPGNKTESVSNLVMIDEMDEPLAQDPCILMLGNEGDGLRWLLRSKADVEVAIEGSGLRGGVDSLNVSVATGILCSAFLKGKGRDRLEMKNKVNEEVNDGINNNKLF